MVLGVLQSSAKPLLLAMDAVGVVVSKVVVALAVAVQPSDPVTVTINVPAVVTIVAAVLALLDHE